MKQDLVRILRDIFISSGYDITDSFRYDLIAEKNGLKTFIKLSYDPDLAEARDFASQITEGEGLYVMAGDTTDELLDQVPDLGLRVWSRDDMALKIGRAVIADIEGTTAELDLLEKSVRKQASKVDEVAQEAINAIFGTGSSPHVEKIALEDPPVPTLARPPAPPTERITEVQYYRPGGLSAEQAQDETEMSGASFVPENSCVPDEEPVEVPPATVQKMTHDPIIMSLHSSPVNISQDRAYSIATPHVRGANAAVLKFVPFWKYNYSLSVEHSYRSKIVDIYGDGSGCINALNGNAESIHLDDIQKTVSVPDVEYDVKMPVTSEEEAQKQLFEMIIDEHTRDLRFDDTQGEAIISEHKRFKPGESDIELHLELVYVPIWEIKGQRNSVEINAYSGEILQNPVDDDVEFV